MIITLQPHSLHRCSAFGLNEEFPGNKTHNSICSPSGIYTLSVHKESTISLLLDAGNGFKNKRLRPLSSQAPISFLWSLPLALCCCLPPSLCLLHTALQNTLRKAEQGSWPRQIFFTVNGRELSAQLYVFNCKESIIIALSMIIRLLNCCTTFICLTKTK